MIKINTNTEIDPAELRFEAIRSSGPGGQNVNKLSTCVRLYFDLSASLSLTEAQKERIQQRLRNRISKEGVLSLSAQDERSQSANKQLVISRFQKLLAEALFIPRRRKATKVSYTKRKKRQTARVQQKQKKSRRGNLSHSQWSD